MKEMARKRNPDIGQIDSLMQKTFYDRRQSLVVEKQPAATVVDEYPILLKQLEVTYIACLFLMKYSMMFCYYPFVQSHIYAKENCGIDELIMLHV